MTTLIVTQGQNVVRAPTQLRQFFLCYNAAYLLYNNPPPDLFPPIIDELNKVLNNPIFIAMAAPQLLQSRRSQTTEVLRALLTDATQTQSTLDPLFEQAFVTAPNTLEKALAVLDAAIEHRAAHDAALI